MSPTSRPHASVVIVIDDHVDCLTKTVRAYAAQTAPRDAFEVLAFDPVRVVDWAPTVDRLLAAEAAGLDFRLATLARGSRAAALNLGVRRSRAPLVIFAGDDIVPGTTFVESHLAYHRDHPEMEAVGIGSAVFPTCLKDPFRDWLDASGTLFGIPFQGDATLVPPHFFFIANASVKRGLLDRAGPFNEAFPHHAWDDYEMSLRLVERGMRAGYVRGAEALHEHGLTLEERCESMRLAGESARVLQAIRPGSYGWTRILRRDPAGWLRAAGRWELGARLLGSRVCRERRWQAVLNAAFVAGHREAVHAETRGADRVSRAA